MDTAAHARTAYADASTIGQDTRGIEYKAFARITAQLSQSARHRDTAFSGLAEALHKNQRLWMILARDVALDSNPLPPPLKASIFYLAEFTRQHTTKVIREGAEVAPLIDINTAIMRGLRGEGAN